MKEMFLMFAKTCEISEKICKIENANTKKYLQELVSMLFRLSVDINGIETLVNKYIELNIEVSDISLDMLEFYKNRLNIGMEEK